MRSSPRPCTSLRCRRGRLNAVIRRLCLLLAGLSLFAAACTSEGLPSSYSDQDGRAETQFVNACEESLAGVPEDERPADGYCQCAFYTVAAELTFDEFLELDKSLRDDPGSLQLEDRRLVEGITLPCAVSADDINE